MSEDIEFNVSEYCADHSPWIHCLFGTRIKVRCLWSVSIPDIVKVQSNNAIQQKLVRTGLQALRKYLATDIRQIVTQQNDRTLAPRVCYLTNTTIG